MVFAGQPALAQEGTVTRAEMLWYGVYTVGQTREEKDPTSVTGTRLVSGGIVGPVTNSDRIAIAANIRYGFGYRLVGSPSSAIVPIVHVTHSPEDVLDVTGKPTRVGKLNYNLGINQSGLFIGLKMDGASTTPGVYALQVWHKNRKLLEKNFTIYKP